jgi:hypothetical protein
MSLINWILNLSHHVTVFIATIADNWFAHQIESFMNAAIILNNKSLSPYSQSLSSIIWETNTLSELQSKIDSDLRACKEQLLMIYEMFEEMGLTADSACQCLRLLIEAENIPERYIQSLCFLWQKYKLYTVMQEDLFTDPFLIQQNKMAIYKLFRFQLKPLFGINEEKDIVLKEYYKHQADISKTLELAILTESSDLFHNTDISHNDWSDIVVDRHSRETQPITHSINKPEQSDDNPTLLQLEDTDSVNTRSLPSSSKCRETLITYS